MSRWGWQTKAIKALEQIAIHSPYLTSDDLHDQVEAPRHHNQMGAAFNLAQAYGFIVDTGRMVKSRRGPAKGRKITLWASAHHYNPAAPDADPVTLYLEQAQTGQEALFA
ncbi:MAG: hypothetical protein ACR2M4_05600 [Actinomycetota bacterium]